MCQYVSRKDLIDPREIFKDWILKVQKEIKKEYKIRFNFVPIGSGKRKMVIKKCNESFFDLDYQIVITKYPKDWDINKKAKDIKMNFKNIFDKYKPEGFSPCEDSTQALTTKNRTKGYGYDIIITRYDSNNDFYILYNKKNTNGANNNDYEWEIRSDMKDHRERLNKIEGSEMWNYLRELYKDKRHNYSRNNEKKAYQILNEAVYETLEHFNKI